MDYTILNEEQQYRKIVKDRYASLYNKTHLSDDDIKKLVNYVMGKYSLSELDALKKLINLAIDKKLNIKEREVSDKVIMPTSTLVNFDNI